MNQDIFDEWRNIYTVTDLNRKVRSVLEAGCSDLLWVRGEVSNLARPGSGHIYFSLKDARAQVRCAMFRNANQRLRFRPENGQELVAQARVGLYEERGEYQLIVEQLEPTGQGALQIAFERLKQRLLREGLFESARKQALPKYPAAIGIITSPTGAALQDILKILERRYPAAAVIIYPSAVQGEGAAEQLVRALTEADRRRDCEALLLARGGGSLEDLQAFNDEAVVRAISRCAIPVVTGVGHEIDFTIADFVADQRAPTPSAAAELVSPDQAAIQSHIERLRQRLERVLRQGLQQRQRTTIQLYQRLPRPMYLLRNTAQRLDEQAMRIQRALQSAMLLRRTRFERLAELLYRNNPVQRLGLYHNRRAGLYKRLQSCADNALQQGRQQLASSARALRAVSHQATLQRGYAIVTDIQQNIVRDAARLSPGATLCTRFVRGKAWSTVQRLEQEAEAAPPPAADKADKQTP